MPPKNAKGESTRSGRATAASMMSEQETATTAREESRPEEALVVSSNNEDMKVDQEEEGQPMEWWGDKDQRDYVQLVTDRDNAQKSVKTLLKSIECGQVAERVKGVAEAKPTTDAGFSSASSSFSSGTDKELTLGANCPRFHPRPYEVEKPSECQVFSSPCQFLHRLQLHFESTHGNGMENVYARAIVQATLDTTIQHMFNSAITKVTPKECTVKWCQDKFVELVMTPHMLQAKLTEFRTQGRLEQELFEKYAARLDRLPIIYKIRDHALHQTILCDLRQTLSPMVYAIMLMFHHLETARMDRPTKPEITDVHDFCHMLSIVPGPEDSSDWGHYAETRKAFHNAKRQKGQNDELYPNTINPASVPETDSIILNSVKEHIVNTCSSPLPSSTLQATIISKDEADNDIVAETAKAAVTLANNKNNSEARLDISEEKDNAVVQESVDKKKPGVKQRKRAAKKSRRAVGSIFAVSIHQGIPPSHPPDGGEGNGGADVAELKEKIRYAAASGVEGDKVVKDSECTFGSYLIEDDDAAQAFGKYTTDNNPLSICMTATPCLPLEIRAFRWYKKHTCRAKERTNLTIISLFPFDCKKINTSPSSTQELRTHL
ncbi:MAG: hypothetical protein J3R72DRAFT_428704 [Linnemannia gamsii]|nr:MAG: hypothetical protein J3R72DRAFT_428704 [Linnemannia gamsii]